MRCICSFEGCGRFVQGHGICGSHRAQQRRGLELRPIGPMGGYRPSLKPRPPRRIYTDAERLGIARARADIWTQVDKDGPVIRPELGPCWIWTGCKKTSGYGTVTVAGKAFGTHRLAFMLERGLLHREAMVLHHCDNPPCMRPDHLFAGTGGDNMADAAAKGRTAREGMLPQTKLTRDQVIGIRARLASGERGIDLAAELGVTQATVSDIKHRRKWAWLAA